MYLTSLFIGILFSFSLQAKTIDGVVHLNGKKTQGVLYIFAKKHDGSMPMPLAVKKIPNPQFPVSFSLSESDKMMASFPFKGPFKITARLSPSGSATDKSGSEVSTTKPIQLGQKNIKLLLSTQ